MSGMQTKRKDYRPSVENPNGVCHGGGAVACDKTPFYTRIALCEGHYQRLVRGRPLDTPIIASSGPKRADDAKSWLLIEAANVCEHAADEGDAEYIQAVERLLKAARIYGVAYNESHKKKVQDVR